MEKTLVGFKKFTSKKGQPLCIAIISYPFTAKEVENGCVGLNVDQIFLPQEQYNYLLPGDIGKPVTTQYDIVGGRAYLRELTVDRK